MNVTLRQIRIGLQPMDTLAKSNEPKAKVRYAIGKLLGKMGKEYESMDKEFVKMREKFGTKDDKNDFIVTPDSPRHAEFVKLVDEFLDTTTELTGVLPVHIDDLPDTVELSSGDMLLLGPFLVDTPASVIAAAPTPTPTPAPVSVAVE